MVAEWLPGVIRAFMVEGLAQAALRRHVGGFSVVLMVSVD